MKRLFSLKKIVWFLFILTSFLTLYATFISKPEPLPTPTNLDEKFDPALGIINTPARFDSVIRGKFESSGHDTAATMLFLDNFLRNRFYHSYSELSFHDNWIAYICGRLFWSHFRNPVLPADIIRFPIAGCSQQGILFQMEMSSLKIPCSSIQFYPQKYQSSGHYAVTAHYGGTWHYFDSNLEPTIVDSTMPSLENIIDRKLYPQMYTKKVHRKFVEYFINKSFKKVDNEPFRKGNMHFFQKITDFLSGWIWLFFLFFYFFLAVKRKKPDQELPDSRDEQPRRSHMAANER